MKTCSRCGNEHPLDFFHRDSRSKDGHTVWCKNCKQDHWRENATPERLATIRTREAMRRDEKYRYIMGYLLDHPCVDCGEIDLLVLEFDHRSGVEKRSDRVLSLACNPRSTMTRIINEIAKCDVRCANCHKRITHKRANSWRHQYVLDNGDVRE